MRMWGVEPGSNGRGDTKGQRAAAAVASSFLNTAPGLLYGI